MRSEHGKAQKVKRRQVIKNIHADIEKRQIANEQAIYGIQQMSLHTKRHAGCWLDREKVGLKSKMYK